MQIDAGYPRGGLVVTAGLEGESRTKRQQLAAELRRLRDLAGVSGREMANRLQISQSKVSRIESAATTPSLPEVTKWAEVVGAVPEKQELLIALTEGAFTEVHSWRAALRDKPHVQDEISRRESSARLVQIFEPSVVPGLLQTAEYARRVFSLLEEPTPKSHVAAAVAGRMNRQVILYEEEINFEFLITESALRWRPGPPRMLLAQLDRIRSLSSLGNVSIGLIPSAGNAIAFTSHNFVIYGEHDDGRDDFVEVEMIHGNALINESGDVELYKNRWPSLREMALFDDAAGEFLDTLAADLRAIAG